jgi:hypothetical protein
MVHGPDGGFGELMKSNFINVGVFLLFLCLSIGGTVVGAREGWRLAKFPGSLFGALTGDFIGIVLFLLCAYLIDLALRHFRARRAHRDALWECI